MANIKNAFYNILVAFCAISIIFGIVACDKKKYTPEEEEQFFIYLQDYETYLNEYGEKNKSVFSELSDILVGDGKNKEEETLNEFKKRSFKEIKIKMLSIYNKYPDAKWLGNKLIEDNNQEEK